MSPKGFVLGLNLGKVDPSATLFYGTSVVAHVEEERFSRRKKAIGEFPIQAISYCLQQVPGGLEEVEAINLGFDHDMFTYEVPLYFLEEWSKFPDKPPSAVNYEKSRLTEKHPDRVRQRIERALVDAGLMSAACPPINFYSHHLSHALTAHMSSPFEDSLGIVVDANSEIDTVSVWDCRGTSLHKIYDKGLPHSLGWVYRAFTQFCGFEPYEGEGKLMGLAPYGRSNPEIAEKIAKIIIFDENGVDAFEFSVDATFIYLGARSEEYPVFTQKFINEFGTPCEPCADPAQYYKDLAYEIQDRFEKLLMKFARRFLTQTSHLYMTLSGGVFLNCKASGYIWRECQDLLDDIYIFPMSADDGIGYGANLAYAVEHYSSQKGDYLLESAYLGPQFDAGEIRRAAAQFKLRNKFLRNVQYGALINALRLEEWSVEDLCYRLQEPESFAEINRKAVKYLERHLTPCDDIVSYTAKKIAEGKVVAWFQGRMEAGPRALGARSILADPRTVDSRDKVNAKVKFRELWRPFCPSVLWERADEYFELATQSPFMINTFAVTAAAKEKAPAIVHVDGTARPQFVTAKANGLFHALISEFERLSGVPILLNTSMNIKGEPICCTPHDAFQFFFATDIDVLVVGDAYIAKGA